MNKSETFDIVIAGGGLAGTSLAIALGQQSAWRIALIEAYVPEEHDQAVRDMRSIALSYASWQFLVELDIWKDIQDFATAIKKIHVSEEKRFGKVLLDAAALDLETFGYVVPIGILYKALQAHLECLKNNQKITLIRPAKLTQITQYNNKNKNNNNKNNNNKNIYWILDLNHPAHQTQLKTNLLIAADGEKSFIRETLNLPVKKIDYQQTALVTTARISKKHDNTAYERFMSDGVLAVLPREDNRVAVILTVDHKNLDLNFLKSNLQEKIQLSMGYKLGKFSELGEIQTYPLKSLALKAEKQVLPGLVLLGNAAHVLHPVAAQGLNLGLRDVRVLSELLKQNKQGFCEKNLAEYLKQRKNDQQGSQKFTADLIRIFRPQNFAASCMRSLGLSAFDLMPVLKKNFCLKRMGLI